MAPKDWFRARDVVAGRRCLPYSLRCWAWTLVGCLVLLLPATRTAVADVVDQSNAPARPGGGAHYITVQSAQTVMPPLGCLTRVDVSLTTGNRGRGGDQVTLTVS